MMNLKFIKRFGKNIQRFLKKDLNLIRHVNQIPVFIMYNTHPMMVLKQESIVFISILRLKIEQNLFMNLLKNV